MSVMSYSIISPHSSAVYRDVKLIDAKDAADKVSAAAEAFKTWKATPFNERHRLITAFVEAFVNDKDAVTEELAHMIGRPFKQNYNEVNGFASRAQHLLQIAEKSLSTCYLEDQTGFKRYIKREPLGVIFVISAWNYPYLIAVNGIVPALLSGNTVILKAAPQTFLTADRLTMAARKAGLPAGVFDHLHVDHDVAATVIKNPDVAHILFTGSVAGGRSVQKIASHRFIGVGLELGGKDAAYVRADADIVSTAANLVDGACYNSGQSCCGIERVYAHRSIFDQLVKEMVIVASKYNLGDPFQNGVDLGPVICTKAADTIRAQVADAVKKGAKTHVDESKFPAAKSGSAFVSPQILTNVDHTMVIMTEETFGPVVGVMPVDDDEEAVRLINDSNYGLTASIWTADLEAAERIGEKLEVGTIFMNRCDYLDPALCWTGVKDSGRGGTLSHLGFHYLTRPKNFHLRK